MISREEALNQLNLSTSAGKDEIEQAYRLLSENIQITKRKDAFWCLLTKLALQGGWIPHIGTVNALYNHHQVCPSLP